MDFEPTLRRALAVVTRDLALPELVDLQPDTNLIDVMDSMTIVDFLLESESLLESETGRYVALADETVFDASLSPLRCWHDWVRYVAQRHGASMHSALS